jgi:hypothetical protein
MRYSLDPALDAEYARVAQLAEPQNPGDARLDEVMAAADTLIARGEDRSWASVWWAYAALHYDMSDEALARAFDLLARVKTPSEARAAALMLQAEIRMTQAAYAGEDPSASEQQSLLEKAVGIVPDWPSLRLRLARANKANGQESQAADNARRALTLLRDSGPSDDPFDSAITGRNIDLDYLENEVAELGALGP